MTLDTYGMSKYIGILFIEIIHHYFKSKHHNMHHISTTAFYLYVCSLYFKDAIVIEKSSSHCNTEITRCHDVSIYIYNLSNINGWVRTHKNYGMT